MKTLSGCKDEATKKITQDRYTTWDLLIDHASGGLVGTHIIIIVLELSAKLYAIEALREAAERMKNKFIAGACEDEILSIIKEL